MLININQINESWHSFVLDESVQKELTIIEKKIKNKKYFPRKKNIFRFMNQDLYNLNFVLMGMDPYPQEYELIYPNGDVKIRPVATGRCFEPDYLDDWDDEMNKSLENILKVIYLNENNTIKSINEIREEIANNEFKILPPHEWFDNLENQGILLLNYALTVKAYNPGSHINLWSNFTTKLVNYITENNNNINWILLGKNAQMIDKYIDNKKVIYGPHPSYYTFVNKNNCFKDLDIDFTGYQKKR